MAKHTFLPPTAAKAAEPLLNDRRLRGAFVYYDGHVPMPERLCLEAAQQAANRGAFIANHARAIRLRRQNDTFVVTMHDELTGQNYELRALSVVNATGPWADVVNDTLLGAGHRTAVRDNAGAAPKARDGAQTARLRHTKGIHLLVPKLSEHGVVMLAEADGRLFFAIPWGQYTYIGTTDTDFSGDLDTVAAQTDEIRYLMEETQRVFPEADLQDVHFTTAGVRPLVRDPKARSEGQVSRKHLILHHTDEGLRGYFSVLGGKITNMRSVAEEAVDDVIRYLNVSAEPCTTRRTLFPGGMHPDMNRLKQDLIRHYAEDGIKADTIENIVDLYGSNAGVVLQLVKQDESLAERIMPDGPDIWAQLEYGIRHEWVYTTADFLIRRTAVGLGPGMAMNVAPEVARRLGNAYGRTEQQVADDVAAYEQTVVRMSGTLGRPVDELLRQG